MIISPMEGKYLLYETSVKEKHGIYGVGSIYEDMLAAFYLPTSCQIFVFHIPAEQARFHFFCY